VSMPTDLALVAAATRSKYGEPEQEFRFHPVRKWRFDLAWPELKVALERHGSTWTRGHHTRGAGFRDDREKMNTAQTMGWLVIEATADMLKSGMALDHLLAALQLRDGEAD
jgi:hypothetical protein